MARGLYSGGEVGETGPARGFTEFEGATRKSPSVSCLGDPDVIREEPRGLRARVRVCRFIWVWAAARNFLRFFRWSRWQVGPARRIR
jgi:hypothetical protein